MTESERSVTEAEEPESPPPGDEDDTLKWRGDPQQTFSDWVIEVVGKTPMVDRSEGEVEEKVDTYNVHKFALAVGSRKSKYFSTLFRGSSASGNNSRMELDPLQAQAFPFLLDFVYNTHKPLAADTKSGTALHSLGCLFEMPHLQWDAKQFCKRDMSIETIAVYYEHAVRLEDDTILGMVEQFVGKNLMSIQPASSLVEKSDPQLWLNSMDWVPVAEEENEASRISEHFSLLIAELGKHECSKLDSDTLCKLLSTGKVPVVHPDAALTLCEAEDKLMKSTSGDTPCGDFEEAALQQRCASALSHRWKDILNADKVMVSRMVDRKPAFLVDLLLKSLKKAGQTLNSCHQSDLDALKSASEAEKDDLRRDLQGMSAQLKDSNAKLSVLETECSSLKESKEDLVCKLLEAERVKEGLISSKASLQRQLTAEQARRGRAKSSKKLKCDFYGLYS